MHHLTDRITHTNHGFWYTSCGPLSGTRNISMGLPGMYQECTAEVTPITKSIRYAHIFNTAVVKVNTKSQLC